VICGDARVTLPEWTGRADAWFLDGFSPAKNPELWSDELLKSVASHTAPGGTFATYTAAGHVRRALSDAGFHVERRPGFGRKRHMSAGVLAA
jgi:tRNA U34 5-methylaminomethyl-2-thiouridine-forming methyltransferase MnmC